MEGLSPVAARGATLRCGEQASHRSGFSDCGARALGTGALVVVARRRSRRGWRALECGVRGSGPQAQLLCSIWDLL